MIGQGGDGGTLDIGFACLSGMFERNDDVLFVCYDNEAYMNTGVQRSSATPPAARTSNTKPVGGQPGNVFGKGKNAPLIAMAHEIPYVATATVAELRDLEAKVERAMQMRGARYLHVFVPCPLGWGSASHDTIRIARLVKETGLFPVFEAEDGEVTGVSKIRRPVPVEEYLKLQKRYAHLFGDPPNTEVIARIQARADRNIRNFGLLPDDGEGADLPGSATDLAGETRRGGPGRGRRAETNLMRLLASTPHGPHDGSVVMDKPFAITLDVGSSLANKTGSWRTERAEYVDRLPPCNHACPAGEDIQAWLYEAEEGGEGYERAWRKLMEDNPFPAIMGRVCYHPCETACNRGELDEAVGINSVERFLGDEAISGAGRLRGPRRALGQAGARRRRRPLRPLGRLPPARLGHEVTIHEAGPMVGGMMRFGIPTYRLPRDVLDAEASGSSTWASSWSSNRKVTDVERRMSEGGFDAAFLAVGAHIGKRAYVPPARRRASSTPSPCSSMEGRRSRCSAARGRLRRRQHRDGRRPHREAPRRHRRRRRLPPHPRADARARVRGRGGRGGGRDDAVALDDQAGRRRAR